MVDRMKRSAINRHLKNSALAAQHQPPPKKENQVIACRMRKTEWHLEIQIILLIFASLSNKRQLWDLINGKYLSDAFLIER